MISDHADWNSAVADAETCSLASINPNQSTLFKAGVAEPYFARLRRDAPVHYTAESVDGPFWSITRYSDIALVDADHRRFSSDAKLGGILINGVADPAALPMFIAMDAPEHELRRRTIAPAFSSARLGAMAGAIRDGVAQILDGLPIDEVFDLAATAAPDLAAMALATLFAFPQEQRQRLTRWADVATSQPGGGVVEHQAQWSAEMNDCLRAFDALWCERAAQAPRDDLISMLAHGTATRDMSLAELQGNVILLIVGGHDTTRSAIAAGVLALHRNPDQFARLRADRSLLRGMVAETIRWQTPLAHMRRTALVGVDLHGQHIRAGDKVVLWYVSGNRDDRAIEDPDAFRIDRTPTRHLSFGTGIHRCIGSRFAEMALEMIWSEMLDRFGTIEVIGEPHRTASTFVNGYESLFVRLR